MKYLVSLCLATILLQSCITRAPVVIEANTQEADQAYSNADYERSLKLYQDFQKAHRASKFFMAARLGEAQSLEGLENWFEALAIYRFVYDSTFQRQPEIATQALYRMSFCYEALGDEVKAVATLRDILGRKAYLSDEVSQAEVPARLAMLYSKTDNAEESSRFIEIAQKGLNSLQGRRDISASVLAKACLQMGSISHNQISTDSFQMAVDGQMSVQRYLLKAMKLKTEPWSTQAEVRLKKNFRDLWNTLIELPGLNGMDAESLARRRLELQAGFASSYLDLIENAELYLPLEENKMNNLEKDFSFYLAEAKKRTQALLYEQQGKMGLTIDSQKLNGLKRPGKIKNVVPFPKNKTAEDPNL